VPENEKLKVFPGKLQLISSASGTEAPRLEIDANAYREKVEASIPLCLCDPNSKLLKHLKLQKKEGKTRTDGVNFSKTASGRRLLC